MISIRDIDTSQGLVRLRGDFAHFDTGRPLVFAVSGAFPPETYFEGLAKHLPGCDLVITHLPGMHSPHMAAPSVERFAAAYDEAISQHFEGRWVLKLGVSMGGLVVIAMRCGNRLLAIDPPTRTLPIAPMHARVRAHLARQPDPGLLAWCWRLLGIAPERLADRDYRPLFTHPASEGVVMVAGLPLEAYAGDDRLPGVIPAADRAALPRLTPLKVVFVPNAGHVMDREAPGAVLQALRGLLDQSQVVKPVGIVPANG